MAEITGVGLSGIEKAADTDSIVRELGKIFDNISAIDTGSVLKNIEKAPCSVPMEAVSRALDTSAEKGISRI